MCFEVGLVVETTIGDQFGALSILTWGYLVRASEGVVVGSETQGIEVRGRVIIGGEVGDVVGKTI